MAKKKVVTAPSKKVRASRKASTAPRPERWPRRKLKRREIERWWFRTEYLKGKPLLLDDLEAAELLGISQKEVHRLAFAGDLPRYDGDSYMFDLKDLQRYLLSLAKTVAERRAVALRMLRFEAKDLENYSDHFRLEVIPAFEGVAESLALKLADLGDDENADAARRIAHQVKQWGKAMERIN